ncbi:hypothetical protein K6W36_09975 [Acetobacter senegalensis]|uniref:hypothetical protein n=1 Tax=Acetobacter senegalensis TaxID=446692 RepID=UPI001EDC18D8|nr:hypothetical protein [Acetobacter senegalensis]MCG4260910.1 hypothetical protein [Acetobacter senegalensis]
MFCKTFFSPADGVRIALQSRSIAGFAVVIGLVAVLFSSATRAEVTLPHGFVTVTLKFIRNQAGHKEEPVILDAASCPPCRQSFNPEESRRNRKETIVALQVPRERNLELSFTAAPGLFGQVVLQAQSIPVTVVGNHLWIALPPLTQDTVEAGEYATNIVGQGMVLRFEHADPDRRFGAYSKVLPEKQRMAANNLEFALREAVLELGLGRQALETRVGIIEIMGFDTNDPHGHRDAPPIFICICVGHII